MLTSPKNLGTECTVPGDQCKEYACKIVYTNREGIKPLSSNEINDYAQKEAESLYNSGLIEAESINSFKILISNGIRDMEKKLK